ncbi:LysR family transcriptional regulator [Asaia siamensis]|uniref:Transcriptional regulator n=1 Tax=Asaia siamensis TaxID=110479 RepID=A0ABQ1M2N6_9PROT|nr:LysR substrate-binding domain-containing protein [Asaia siamensis]GBR10126.1 LysR family transcriptional regulator [Asaia siamensis NRIC 0323]GGC32689.1 transcriptional regulator [Asaia siamensis]
MSEAPSPPPQRQPRRMATNMPTELVRSFVAIVDAGSMAQATEAIFLTQSALSLQMKRLEDLLQQKLFRRDGRALTLTAAGEDLLVRARQFLALNDQIVQSMGQGFDPEPIHLGMTQDYADTILPGTLARFHHAHPRARLRLHVGGTMDLLDLYDRSKLDIVLGFGRHAERGDAELVEVAQTRMIWLGNQTHADSGEVPLVLLEPPCQFRNAVLTTLQNAGREHRILLETPHLPGLRAALKSGLGASARTTGYAAAAGLPVMASGSLPNLPDLPTILFKRRGISEAADDLAELLVQETRDNQE